MRIDLRAKVRTRDGHDAGRIERAVYDPESKEITKFLISTGGLFGHEVLVPRSAVDQPTRDGDIVVLELTKDELKTMERYVPQRYLPPPAAWEPPPGAAFAYLAGDYLWPVGVSDEALEVEAGEVPSIRKGARVVDRDDDEIGVVDDLRINEANGQIERFVVKLGGTLERLFGDAPTVELDADAVIAIDRDKIQIGEDKDAIVPPVS